MRSAVFRTIAPTTASLEGIELVNLATLDGLNPRQRYKKRADFAVLLAQGKVPVKEE